MNTDEFILKAFLEKDSDSEMLEFIRELLTEQSGCPDSFKLLKLNEQMETLEELERNNKLRETALMPVVSELMELNRQMAELNREMISQVHIIIDLLMKIKQGQENADLYKA